MRSSRGVELVKDPVTSFEQKLNQEYLTEEFVMRVTGYSKKSIQTFRSAGSDRIPPGKRVGNRWVYPVKEFEQWIKSRELIRPA